MTPRRIQQRRTKSWRKSEGAVAVGRPTKWGNPFSAMDCGRRYPSLTSECWCPLDAPCHADVLLELANGDHR